jgi:hypothetical protein
LELKLNRANLAPGQTTQIVLKLYNPDDLTLYRRRGSAWAPWSVLAGGAALDTGGWIAPLQF